jgi:pilus assembly protein CpaE
VDIEGNAEVALSLIEEISRANPKVTPMVYARRDEPDLLLRCMESGARTLLQEPLSMDALTTAMARASARRAPSAEPARTKGKSILFWSVKGGAGASTIAANFAVALAKSSGQKVALVDLHLDLGDLAVLLDVKPRFSILDAIDNAERMDSDFLSGLMVENSSGVSLLAAPDSFTTRQYGTDTEALLRLLRLLEAQYAFVVVDTATSVNLPEEIVREFESIYLVSQVDIPSLRHAQRLSSYIASLTPDGKPNPAKVVLNRYEARKSMIAADDIESVLKMPVAWRIPNDYSSMRDAANTGVLSVLTTSAVGKTVRQMADATAGKVDESKAQKKGWRLF